MLQPNNDFLDPYKVVLKLVMYAAKDIIGPILLVYLYVSTIKTFILVDILFISIILKYYSNITSSIFEKLQIQLKNDWMTFLSTKIRKVTYYRKVTLFIDYINKFNRFFLDSLNLISKIFISLVYILSAIILFFFYFIFSFYLFSEYGKQFFGINIVKTEMFLNFVDYLNNNIEFFAIITTLYCSILLAITLIIIIGLLYLRIFIHILKSLFPLINGVADTSDIPITFIKQAISELESFTFIDNFGQMQKEKDQITQIISEALEFIKVNNGGKDPEYTNFCYVLYSGHLSKAVKNDILFRTNGLYIKIDEVSVKINNMKCYEDKELILLDLKMYLKIIENRDLSKIDGVPYKIENSNLFISFFNWLFPFIKLLTT